MSNNSKDNKAEDILDLTEMVEEGDPGKKAGQEYSENEEVVDESSIDDELDGLFAEDEEQAESKVEDQEIEDDLDLDSFFQEVEDKNSGEEKNSDEEANAFDDFDDLDLELSDDSGDEKEEEAEDEESFSELDSLIDELDKGQEEEAKEPEQAEEEESEAAIEEASGELNQEEIEKLFEEKSESEEEQAEEADTDLEVESELESGGQDEAVPEAEAEVGDEAEIEEGAVAEQPEIVKVSAEDFENLQQRVQDLEDKFASFEADRAEEDLANKIEEMLLSEEVQDKLIQKVQDSLGPDLENRFQNLEQNLQDADTAEDLSGLKQELQELNASKEAQEEKIQGLEHALGEELENRFQELEKKLQNTDILETLTSLQQELQQLSTSVKELQKNNVDPMPGADQNTIERINALEQTVQNLQDSLVTSADLDSLAAELREEFQEEIKRSAPAAAAQVLREEIAALARELEEED